MKHSRAAAPQSFAIFLVYAAVILFPLLLVLAWGPYFSGADYTALHIAREIAQGMGFAINPVGSFPAPSINSLLWTMMISIPTRLGMDPAWAALILSGLGWSVAGLAMLALGRSINRFRGAAVAALLLSFNPAIITTLGSAASWIVALGWLTLALLFRRRAVLAVFTFFLLIILILPWPLNSSWSHLTQYGPVIFWSILLFIAGVGLDWLAEKLVNRDQARVPYPQMAGIMLAVLFIALGIVQGFRIGQLFQHRAEILWQLEEEVAAWVQTETDLTATLLASERVGFLAQRPWTKLPETAQLETATAVQALLQEQPVDYLVTTNELPWQQLHNLNWFRLAYEPQKQFESPYLPQGPMTIWAYRQPVAGMGARHAFNARVPDRLWIIGYQIAPQEVQAGESINMALYLESPEATFAAPTPFQAIVRLIHPLDFSTVREWTVDLPQTIAPEDWQAKEVIVEQFPLQLPEDLEAGAYLLNLSLLGPESENLWPLSLDNDFNRLDRVPTGYVIVPEKDQLAAQQAVEALFDERIQLASFSTSDGLGDTLDVSLLWEPRQAIDEDYVVFTHLVDGSGQLVANHDSIPGNGRFPTRSWQPGITMPDTHSILLPENLVPGEYMVKVGLYNPQTGQRLAVVTADGAVPEDRSINLTTIKRP